MGRHTKTHGNCIEIFRQAWPVPVEISRYSFCVPITQWSLQYLLRVFTFLSLILCYSHFGTFLCTWSALSFVLWYLYGISRSGNFSFYKIAFILETCYFYSKRTRLTNFEIWSQNNLNQKIISTITRMYQLWLSLKINENKLSQNYEL